MTFDPLGHTNTDEDQRVLGALVKELGERPVIVEVGAWVGSTALEMVRAGAERVYCVDHWRGNIGDCTGPAARHYGEEKVLGAFLSNCREHLFTRIVPCRGSSLFWSSYWPFQVDMVFIDADHEYEAVRLDIEAWLPHVKEGGILAGHDYHSFTGVTCAVRERFAATGFKTDGCLWWVKKETTNAKTP